MPATRTSLLLAALAPVAALGPGPAIGSAAAPTPTATAVGNGTNVNVTPGAQLSTVLAATEVTTRGEIETARFEFEFERGDEAERAEAIREDYEEATAAREAGELSAEAYARRLAELNARAEQLLAEVEVLRAHARNVSALELQAAGLNRSALQSAVEALDPLAGVGPSALLRRFLGESTGEVELRTADGLRVEVEGEDGERSLEAIWPLDDDPSLTAPHDSALQTARATLPPGNWTLEKASVHPDSGYYKFEFGLRATDRTGEAEVRVDGSSGEVFRLEVEIETPDDDREDDDADEDQEEERDDDELEVTLLLVDGTPAPNEAITVRALADGEPAANVTVYINDRPVAEADALGEATIRLPHAAEVEVTAGEGELEFEFDEVAHEERELFYRLDANATLRDGRVTVRVTFDGSPVEGATVYANDRRVGRTDTDGSVTFAFDPNATDELELELVKGAFEAELEYDVRHGELVLTESAHESDDDRDEDEREEDDAEESDDEDDDDSSGSGSGDDEDDETEDDD